MGFDFASAFYYITRDISGRSGLMAMKHSFFNEGACDRLSELFPNDGAERYQRLERFFSIVKQFPEEEFVVPAELDQDLHEVLSARDENGYGFEKYKVRHETRVLLGALGRSLKQLKDPVAEKTRTTLTEHGFLFTNKTYKMHACTVKVLIDL